MPVKQALYEGMMINVGAFEVAGTGRFIVSLAIARRAAHGTGQKTRLFDLPDEHDYAQSADEALEFGLARGRAIIDGEIPGETVADL